MFGVVENLRRFCGGPRLSSLLPTAIDGTELTFHLREARSERCYSQEIAEGIRPFEPKGTIVIAHGSLSKRSQGPKIGSRYDLEVTLEDESGARSTVTGTAAGLCRVTTE